MNDRSSRASETQKANSRVFRLRVVAFGAVAAAISAFFDSTAAETWRGLVLAPEHRCSPYDKKRDYPYSQSVEREIVARLGSVYGPYTGRCFASTSETDIEHIVATSEAHDSGLCAQDRATRMRFAEDLRNLTLASPRVNRHEKSGRDAAEWLPARNRCWFAARVVEVRRAYGLTIDRREAAALQQVLSECESTAMEPLECHFETGSVPRASSGGGAESGANALERYDDNGNGRITCKEARRHGIAPVPESHPAYQYMHDGDGIVCESTAMEPLERHFETGSVPRASSGGGAESGANALERYDDNDNGRITCKEARRHGIAPVRKSHPAYQYMRDGDGIVCE